MAVLNTRKRLFAYNRLAFGIASAPALFQRRLESVLQGLPRVKVYLDDIIIAEKENDESTLRQVFERLRDNGLKLNLDKCRFREKQVMFLGHKIDATGLHPPQNMEAITAAPRPATVSQLKSFLADLSRSDDKLQRIRGWISRGWPRHLSAAQQHLMPYFSRRNETTPLERGKSPAELLFGFSPRTRLTASLTDIKVTENDSGEPVPAVTKSPTRYQPGKPVWSRQFRSARKWMPATVVSTTGARMVTLETPEGSQRHHVDQLRPRLDVGSPLASRAQSGPLTKLKVALRRQKIIKIPFRLSQCIAALAGDMATVLVAASPPCAVASVAMTIRQIYGLIKTRSVAFVVDLTLQIP
ncbi:uncharacterized protein LOC144105071 [Amblyomma americanum]